MRWSGCSERARRTKLDSASRDLLSFQHRSDSVPRAIGNDKRTGTGGALSTETSQRVRDEWSAS